MISNFITVTWEGRDKLLAPEVHNVLSPRPLTDDEMFRQAIEQSDLPISHSGKIFVAKLKFILDGEWRTYGRAFLKEMK